MCLGLSNVDLKPLCKSTFATDQPTDLSPFLQIMIGKKKRSPQCFFISQLRELKLRLNTASPYSIWLF